MLQSVGFASCSDYSNSLRLQIPELAPWPQRFERFSKLGLVKICLKSQVSPREYVYLIDEPIGTAPTALAALASARMIFGHQRVGYCYGVDCMDTRTLRPNNCTSADCNTGDVLQGWKTPESLQGWFSVGQVEVVNTKEDRDAIVRKMFELPALKARRIRETPPKLCSTDWYLQDNDTFYFVRRHNTVVFKCNDGFANLKGVEELHCDDGQWKVAKHSEDNPMEEKLSPPDMAVWEPGQFPECSWALADTCKSDDPLNVVSKRSPPVMNDFSGDGLVHYRCGLISGNPARLVIKGATAIKKGEEVIYNGREVGQVVGHEGPKYQIKLVDSGKQLTVQPDLLEWLPQATSFVRRCGPDKKYVPADVEIRCLLVLPSDAPDSVAGDFSSAGFATEQQAAKMASKAKGQAKPPAASLLEQSSSSLLEASAAGASHTGEASLQRSSSLLEASAAGASHSWEAQEAVDASLQLQLQPWPVMLSEDAEYVLHVDSCWISAINCSDGTVAKDTVRALQRTPVALDEMPPPVEDAIQLSWGLAGCVALALVLLLMLLGWSSQRPRETGKRGTAK
ncbi:PLT2 [Symbiodinium natans]|uniref:PLT2 protein n=1 Tax=Symbiodinium natans TaxID=878477 RepID=A0A812TLL2_9DINO|nr:PLT2 [Symbiodinium natans]